MLTYSILCKYSKRMPTKTKKILLLEEDEPLRETLVELLTLNGYMVYNAENGSIGISMAKELTPDLILCASQFSDISCWEVFTILRKEKSTRNIPFLCISSRPLKDEDRVLPNQVSILIKPFNIKTLIDKIENSISSLIE